MEFVDTAREIVVKINQNNTSLTITLPPYLKELYNLKKGDWVCFIFKGKVQKEK